MESWTQKIIQWLLFPYSMPLDSPHVDNPHESYLNNESEFEVSQQDVLRLISVVGYSDSLSAWLTRLKRHDNPANKCLKTVKYASHLQVWLHGFAYFLIGFGLIGSLSLLIAIGLGVIIWSRNLRYQVWKHCDSVNVVSAECKQFFEHGGAAEIRLMLYNKANLDLYDVLVYIEAPFSSEGAIWHSIPHLKATSGEEVKLSFVMDKGVGVYPLKQLTMSVSDRLGLHTYSVHKALDVQIQIAPLSTAIAEFPLPVGHSLSYSGLHETRHEGASCNFLQLRAWRDGDNYRHIHWSKSLKTDSLLVSTFESTAQLKCYLFIDYRSIGHSDFEEVSSYNDLFNNLYSFSQYLSDEEIDFRVITEHWDTQMGKGTDHLSGLFWHIMSTECTGERSACDLLIDYAHDIEPGSLVVLFVTTAGFDCASILIQINVLIEAGVDLRLVMIDSTAYSTQLMTLAQVTDGAAWLSVKSAQEMIEDRSEVPDLQEIYQLISQKSYRLTPKKNLNEVICDSAARI